MQDSKMAAVGDKVKPKIDAKQKVQKVQKVPGVQGIWKTIESYLCKPKTASVQKRNGYTGFSGR